jgi:hypothetical protein
LIFSILSYIDLSDKISVAPTLEKMSKTPIRTQEKDSALVRHTTDEHVERLNEPLLLASWLLELTCFAISLSVLAVVIGVLSLYDRRPNPQWTGGMTLNTVVSFASMVFRGSLMTPVASCISQLSWVWLAQARRPLYDIVRFDEASRGVYGSLKLLYSHHVR